MSKIILKTIVLSRLSKICETKFPIRIEILNHKIYAITSDKSIGVVEYLGETEEKDSICNIKLDKSLLTFIESVKYSEKKIIIETIPEIATGNLIIDDFLETSCFIWPESAPYENWKEWIVQPESNSKGFMFWNVYEINKLFNASPSGELTFPEFFNTSKPVLIRDINDSSWVGFFIPKAKTNKKLEPAGKPDWWAK